MAGSSSWAARHADGPGKRADYILCCSPDMSIAVVEAKPDYKTPGDALQQAKAYAEILGFRFAYATTGAAGVERPPVSIQVFGSLYAKPVTAAATPATTGPLPVNGPPAAA